jgi:HlyD family secretion protein
MVRLTDEEPAILFADLGRLRVRAEVDERFVHELHAGMPAEIYGRTLGKDIHQGAVTLVKRVMGPKTVFARSAVERVDLDVVQLFVDMPADFQAPVGLRVDVRIDASAPPTMKSSAPGAFSKR